MTYASWEPPHRVSTIPPGKLDIFVATFIDGRRGALQPINEYEAALAKARAFLASHRCHIKVLPLSALEARNLLGIVPAHSPQPIDPADLQRMIGTLRNVIRESTDDDARKNAFDLLDTMGALESGR